MKTIARIVFCFLPALVAGAISGALFDSVAAGFVIGVAFVGLGWQVTQARPERGEY